MRYKLLAVVSHTITIALLVGINFVNNYNQTTIQQQKKKRKEIVVELQPTTITTTTTTIK